MRETFSSFALTFNPSRSAASTLISNCTRFCCVLNPMTPPCVVKSSVSPTVNMPAPLTLRKICADRDFSDFATNSR
jgi:hypothetical protein